MKRDTRVAIVTGASSGIGRAIAEALSRDGGTLGLVGRRLEALNAVARRVEGHGARAVCLADDLVAPGGAERLARRIAEGLGATDLLIHCAGVFPVNRAESDQAREHPRAADTLTRLLLPRLRAAPGQIVFVNSSVGLPGVQAAGVYAESKQELRKVADRLRDEVNPDGIRVLSIYPGRTATPMQAIVHRQEGRPYQPDQLLQPEDVAEIVCHALAMRTGAEVTDISIRPTRRP